MAGLGGLGFFLGGMGTAFQNSYNASAELQLKKQQMAMQEKREQMSRAEKARSELWDVIAQNVTAASAAGADPSLISKNLSPLVEHARQFDQQLGYDPSISTARFSALLARPSSSRMLDQPQAQQQGQQAPQGGDSGQVHPELQNTAAEIQRLARVIDLAEQQGDKGTSYAAKEKIKELLHPHHGGQKDVQVIHDNGRVFLIDKNTKKAEEITLPKKDSAEAGDVPVEQKYDKRTLFKAEQLLQGNMTVVQGLGRNGSERKLIFDAAADLAIERGMKPEDVNSSVAEFMGKKAAAIQAGRRIGVLVTAMDAAESAMSRVVETSSQVDRTKYPTINKVILAWREGTGDESVVQYAVALNTLINEYARAVGGGNQAITDTARQEAREILQAAWSEGQIKSAVAQMRKELQSNLQGARKALKDVTKDPGEPNAAPDPKGMSTEEILQELNGGR